MHFLDNRHLQCYDLTLCGGQRRCDAAAASVGMETLVLQSPGRCERARLRSQTHIGGWLRLFLRLDPQDGCGWHGCFRLDPQDGSVFLLVFLQTAKRRGPNKTSPELVGLQLASWIHFFQLLPDSTGLVKTCFDLRAVSHQDPLSIIHPPVTRPLGGQPSLRTNS